MKKNKVLLLFFVHAVFVQTQAEPTGVRPGLPDSEFNSNTCNFGLIPLQLMQFTAHTEGGEVKLNWRTTMQQNNHGFSVQYSTDGCGWQSVGFVAGAESNSVVTSYQFIHFHPVSLVNYYRLEQVDFDGNKSYGPVLEVQFEQKRIPILLYPNPVTATIFAQLPSTDFRFTIQVVNINGRIVRTYNDITGGRIVSFDVSSFDRGLYIVEINNAASRALIEKFKMQKL